jgi:hypothetical protein
MSRMDDGGDGDCDSNFGYLWESITRRALNGRRGQGVLRELEAALVALPEKRLVKEAFARDGEVCALGALALKRQMDKGVPREAAIAEIHKWGGCEDSSAYDCELVGVQKLGLVRTLSHEVQHQNDLSGAYKMGDGWKSLKDETPEQRYERVLAWVREWIKPEAVLP